MRELNYRLENGTTVKTMAEAKTSGQNYKVEVVEIAETPNIFQSAKRKRIKIQAEAPC